MIAPRHMRKRNSKSSSKGSSMSSLTNSYRSNSSSLENPYYKNLARPLANPYRSPASSRSSAYRTPMSHLSSRSRSRSRSRSGPGSHGSTISSLTSGYGNRNRPFTLAHSDNTSRRYEPNRPRIYTRKIKRR